VSKIPQWANVPYNIKRCVPEKHQISFSNVQCGTFVVANATTKGGAATRCNHGTFAIVMRTMGPRLFRSARLIIGNHHAATRCSKRNDSTDHKVVVPQRFGTANPIVRRTSHSKKAASSWCQTATIQSTVVSFIVPRIIVATRRCAGRTAHGRSSDAASSSTGGGIIVTAVGGFDAVAPTIHQVLDAAAFGGGRQVGIGHDRLDAGPSFPFLFVGHAAPAYLWGTFLIAHIVRCRHNNNRTSPSIHCCRRTTRTVWAARVLSVAANGQRTKAELVGNRGTLLLRRDWTATR
jgi:hypothetical protein